MQEVYYDTTKKFTQLTSSDKGKQQEGIIQNKVFLYKLYNITSEYKQPRIPKPIFIQEEVNNLEKVLKILELPAKTILFYPPLYYKNLWKHKEQDKPY